MTAKTYGVVALEIRNSYDGLGFLQAIVDDTLPQAPMCEVLGFHLIEVENGRAVFEGLPDFCHYNPIGTVHAGFAATLPPGSLRVKGEAVCATVRGLPVQPCFSLQRISDNSFRGAISGLSFAYCDFNHHNGRTTVTHSARGAQPLGLRPSLTADMQ